MTIRYRLPVVAATAILVSPVAAYASVSIDFSFTGFNGGTVGGVLVFAGNTGTQAPTSAEITSLPTKFNALIPTPFYFASTGTHTGQVTFSQGNIIRASMRFHFTHTSSVAPSATSYLRSYALVLNHTSANSFHVSYSSHAAGGSLLKSTTIATRNTKGFSGLTFITVQTPAPEPASIALLGAGIAGIAAFRRRRRRA